ncbi:MAG: glycosyltransferase family 4 protein [Anaerolineae bacterium]|nr:glycosyltransferase family 4 protein [Anaerolineae bacterium]
MHILIASGIFHPEPGGPSTYLLHLLPELQARGHQVEVVAFSDNAPAKDYGYPVTRIRRTRFLQRQWRYYQAIQERIHNADLLFVNSLGLPLPRIGPPRLLKIVGDLAWERAVNRGWLPPTTDIDTFQRQRYGPHVQWLQQARAREAQRANRIIVPSQYLSSMVQGWGVAPEKIEVIYNAYSAPPSGPSVPDRLALGVPEDALLLLAVARLVPWKGIDAVMQALLAVKNGYLWIAGDGPDLAHLRALAIQFNLGERVRF